MPGVKGTFEVENRASAPLREMRTDAASTKDAFRDLGLEMDKVGANTAGLDHYRSELRDLRSDVSETSRSIGDAFDKADASVAKSVAAMKGELDDLQIKMKEVSQQRATPDVDVRGIDESLAKIELLEAKLKELDRERARPRVLRSEIGGGGGGGGGGGSPTSVIFGGASSAASDAGGLGAAVPSLAIKAAAALPVLQSLTGATTALVSSMTGAALGTGAVGLAGGGTIALGIGSILAIAKPAVSEIEAVVKAQTSLNQAVEESTMPGMQQTQQLRQVVQAENQLQQAQYQSRQAQIALTEARRQARNQLVNLGLEAQSAALGEKQAALTLVSSKQQLYEAQTNPRSQPLQIEQGELAVRQAELGIRQSRQQDKEAVEAARIARVQGVAGNPQVQSAVNSKAQSVLAVRNARWSEEEARKSASGGGSSVETARRAYDSALSKAPPGTRQLIDAGRAFISEWKDATKQGSRDFVGLLSGGVAMARRMLPTLAGASNRDTGALAAAGGSFEQWVSSPQDQAFITTGSKMFAENLGAGEQSLTHIFGTVENIITASRPFVKEATDAFDRWTGGWERSTSNVAKTREEIGRMVEDAKTWERMWMSGWHLLHDIMVAGDANAQGNNLLGDFTKTMDRWDSWVKQNPQKVKSFFTSTVEGAKQLAGAVAAIAHSLNEVATEVKPLMSGGLNVLKALSSTGLTSSVGGLGGIYGLYRGGRNALTGATSGRSSAGTVIAGGTSARMVPGAMAAQLLLGGGGRGEIVGNVRTMPNVATRDASGRLIVSSATGRPISADAEVIAAREAAAAGSPFLSIAEREGPGGIRGVLSSARGGLASLGGKAGSVAESGARIAAPYVAANDLLSLAGGTNPFRSSSGVKGALGGAAQGAILGAGLGSVVPVLGTAVGGALGAAGGLVAGVASNAGALHRDIFGKSSSEKAAEGLASVSKQLAALGGNLSSLDPAQLEKLNTEATKLAKDKAISGWTVELTQLEKATGPAARAWKAATENMSGSVSAMRSAAKRNFGEVEAVVDTTAEGIKQELGTKSLQAKDALSANFEAAARAVQSRMAETGEFTRAGIDFVNKEMREALGVYGIKVPKNASSGNIKAALEAARTGDKDVGFSAGGAAQDLTPAARKAAGRASGGRLPGRGSYDTVRMSDGGYGAPGELVVNGHTEARANFGLWRAGMPSLASLVAGENVPHSTPMRAKGGEVGGGLSHYDRLVMTANRVSAENFPYRYGGGHEQPSHLEPFDCSGAVSYATQHAGYNVPTTTAQDMGSWGFPAGTGQATIFYKGGPEAHTFMRIGGRYWGTSGFARPGGGAGWFDQTPSASYLAGFNRVHLPGLGSDTAGLVGGSAGGGITLGVPTLNNAGLAGVLGTAAVGNYARGLAQKGNEALGAMGGQVVGSAKGGKGAGDPLRDSLMPAAGGSRVGASYYGGPTDPSSGTVGYRGDNLNQHPDSYAELNMGHALGSLPYLTPLRVSYGGRSAILKKRDIGAGGAPVDGYPRAMDVWYQAAQALGLESAGLGVVNVERAATGRRTGYAGAFRDGGSFTTRPGKPMAFVAGEGADVEDVHIAPRRGAPRHAPAIAPRVEVNINVGDVTVKDAGELEEVLEKASDRAAQKMIAAFQRIRDRQVAGTRDA